METNYKSAENTLNSANGLKLEIGMFGMLYFVIIVRTADINKNFRRKMK